MSELLQCDSGGRQLQELTLETTPPLEQCLQTSYPLLLSGQALQDQLDLALEEAGTLQTHPLKPRKQSILAQKIIIG